MVGNRVEARGIGHGLVESEGIRAREGTIGHIKMKDE